MAFLIVRFESDQPLSDIINQLDGIDRFAVLGDWHEFRLENVAQVGQSLGSAPAQSVIKDRAQNGRSVYVELTLANGTQVQGQLREASLLLSGRELEPSGLQVDRNVGRLIHRLAGIATIVEVEFG